MVIASSQAMPTYPAMSSGTPHAFNPAAIPALMLTLPSVAILTALLMDIVSITAPPAISSGFPVAAPATIVATLAIAPTITPTQLKIFLKTSRIPLDFMESRRSMISSSFFSLISARSFPLASMEATPSLVACVRVSLLIIWASVSSESPPAVGGASLGKSEDEDDALGEEDGRSGSVISCRAFLMASWRLFTSTPPASSMNFEPT